MNAKTLLEKTESSTYQRAFLLRHLEEAAQAVLDSYDQDADKDQNVLKLIEHARAIVDVIDVVDVPRGKTWQDEGKLDPPK